MLIVLHNVENSTDVANAIKDQIEGFSVVYRPKNLADYITMVKKYHPADEAALILTRSHYDEIDHWSMDVSRWRFHEHFLAKQGGAVWGKDQDTYESATYSGELESIDKVLEEAAWNNARAKHTNYVSSRLLSRSSMDPHTILVGYGIDYPADSKPFRYIIGTLPSDWWKGVGFVRAANFSKKLANWYEYSNYVSIGENSHNLLTERGIEHGALPLVPGYTYTLKMDFRPEFGIKVRELAKTKEKELDWTYPGKL